MEKAFFYQNEYYLLPEDSTDTETLLWRHGDGKPFAVTMLCERKCMAPYFTSKAKKTVKLKLTRDSVLYPCEVEILTQKEYNARLRALVRAKCEGCPNFGSVDETDASLEGHHEEMSLDGVCFYRAAAESDAPDFFFVNSWILQAVKRFAELDLEAMIDRGEYEAAEEKLSLLIAETAYHPVPPIWLSKNVRTGKYEACTTAVFDDSDALLMEHLFGELAKTYPKSWTFHAGIPRGFYPREAEKPIGVEFTLDDEVRNGLSLVVYAKKGRNYNAYLWLCGLLGEAEMHSVLGHFKAIELDEGEPVSSGIKPPEAIENPVKIMLLQMPDEEIRYPAVRVFDVTGKYADESGAPIDTLPEENYLQLARSLHYAMDFVDPLQNRAEPCDLWSEDTIVSRLQRPIARIIFTDVPLSSERFSDDVSSLSESLKSVMRVFHQTIYEDAVEVFGVVLNMTEMLYMLRRYAPLFLRYPAELMLYTASGRNGGRYRLGYDMTLLEDEETMWERLSAEPV